MAAGLLERAADEIDLKTSHFIVKIYAAADVVYGYRAAAFMRSIQDRLRIADLLAQALARDVIAGSNHDRALNRIFQLTNIAGPGMGFQQSEHLGRDLFRHFATVLLVVLAYEMLGQRQDVLSAIAQRWQFNRHDGKAIVQI